MAAAEVNAADPERDSGADASRPQRLVASGGGLSGLEFEPDAVIEGVTLRLTRGDEDVLAGFGSLGILNGCIDLLEEAQIVEPPLRFEHLLLAERCARLHL